MDGQMEERVAPEARRRIPPPLAGILKILHSSGLGGMERGAYFLLQEMVREEMFRFKIATPRPFGEGEGVLRQADPLCRSFEYAGRFGWRTFRLFRAYVHSLAEDTEHIWITGPCAYSLAAVRGLPHLKVLDQPFHHFDRPATLLKWFAFYHGLCRQLDVITFPSHFARNEALTVAPWLQSRAHVVRPGFHLHCHDEGERLTRQAEARRKLNLPQDAFIIGNAGSLVPRKRFDVFLHTAARVRNRMSDAAFVICGSGPLEEELRHLAARLGLAGVTLFTGCLANLALQYQAWDVCLFNSDSEALGRVPMEAASHGCVTVASVAYGGLSEYLKTGENGVLLEKHDPERLADEIVELRANPSKATAFRQASASVLLNAYSLKENLTFYRSIFA